MTSPRFAKTVKVITNSEFFALTVTSLFDKNMIDKSEDLKGKYMLLGRKKELVIQGLHMVSGTRCPAWSDQLKKWSESRAAAPKGRCPVGHRGEFPYVHPS